MAYTIAIIGALEKEVRQIYEALADGAVADEAGLRIMSGSLHGIRLVTTTAGMGTVNAGAAAQHLISRYGADAIIFSGIAGGLNPALHIGDVVVGERLRYIDTDCALIAESTPYLEEYASTPELVEVAEAVLREHGYALAGADAPSGDRLRYLRGTIATGNKFITGDELRRAVVEATGADCAEMEGAAIAHVAAKNGVDCLVLRAISDNCDEAYDAFCERTFDLDEYARTASGLTLDIVERLAARTRAAARPTA